ncbi:SDR family oxidoreductase [Sphingobium aromaticiconvertens]|uniref:SDR family NAD(P)-dependent oxidoreductase n=1 Tax=Sphingobium aromaticiconvertens TaxID=365341 RepID=UPI00301902C9
MPETVMVTGGGLGIGRAVALEFAAKGSNVAIVDLNAADASETAELVRNVGAKALVLSLNVTDEDAVSRAVDEIVDRFGGLDCAFNGAGMRQNGESLADLSLKTWRAIMDVNVTGVFLCLKAQMRAMREHGGAIVNASSMLGVVGSVNTAAYTSSKHAVIGLTRVAAIEGAPKRIRVNAVAPGFTATPMTSNMLPGGHAELERLKGPEIPLGRLAAPEEIANVIAWLLSSQSSYVTGHTLVADAGFTAK